MANRFLGSFGQKLADYLSADRPHCVSTAPQALFDNIRRGIKPGDVLLVEGSSRFSTAIKYLTQSTWSHAAIYVGKCPLPGRDSHSPCLIEADVAKGVIKVPLSKYTGYNLRICRPVGLSPIEIDTVIAHLESRLGHTYDLKNIRDLARWLFPTPPVPSRFRRRLISFGSGDPTQAICSTLIAQAYQKVNYPILPNITTEMSASFFGNYQTTEVLHRRHFSLFVPRDFDVSPYFAVIKPLIENDFDPRTLRWSENDANETEKTL